MNSADRELALLDMTDWFQVATIGQQFHRFGRGLYEPIPDKPRGGHPVYLKRVHNPNKTEIMHGPPHVIRTTATLSHTAELVAKDPSSLSAALKQDSFERHCLTCANSILFGVGRDEIVTYTEPCYQYDDIDGYIPTLDENGEHLRMLDDDGEPMFLTYEKRIRTGSGLVERLGAPPFKWGMDVKWRLRIENPSGSLRYLSNMQAVDEDCVKSEWRSEFRVEITSPEPTPYQVRDQRYWPGWRDSVEWNDVRV